MRIPSTRWQRVTSMAAIWAWKDKVYHDADKKFTAEDIDETAYVLLYLGAVWSPQIAVMIPALAGVSTPLAVVEGAFIAGGVASFAIGGLEGLETYVDFFDTDIVTDSGKSAAVVQAADIALSVVNPLHIPTKWAAENLPWGQIFRNRFVTGPYLPF